jgi:hypothetical protein
MDRREVIATCVELGIPITHGRIDKTLFMAGVGERAEQPVSWALLDASGNLVERFDDKGRAERALAELHAVARLGEVELIAYDAQGDPINA